MVSFTASEREAIGAAVTAAEATTDAEIVPIIASESDSYRDVALHWALLGTLLVPAVLAALPNHGLTALDGIAGWDRVWTGGELLTALLVLLASVFLLLDWALRSPRLLMILTPAATKQRRVRRRAILLFRSAIEARTATATGVLIYVSIAERCAEIVADRAIVAEVAPAEWGEAMAVLVDSLRAGAAGAGMIAAIERVGAVLAKHFPHTGTDPNELPDRLIEL